MSNITEEAPLEDLDLEFRKELELNDLHETHEVEHNELKYTQTSNISSNIVSSDLIAMNQPNLNPESCEYDKIIKKLKDEFTVEFDFTCVCRNMKQEDKKQNDVYTDTNNILKQNSKKSQRSWNSNLEELLSATSSAATISTANNSLTRENNDYNIGIKINLDSGKIDIVKLTHAISIEFLRQFWTQLNKIAASTPTTDPNFKSDLIKLRKYSLSVKKCLSRVETQLARYKDLKKRQVENQMLTSLIEALNAVLHRYEGCIVKSK